MERTILPILLLSLLALPMLGVTQQKLTTARCAFLERIAGGWRMEILCEEGKGSIVMLDSGKQFRGNGLFAGWSQEQMRTMYQALLPPDASSIELLQLG